MDIALGNVPSSVLDNTDNVIFTEGELAKKVQYSDMKTDIVGSANLSTAAQTPKEAINELNQDLLDSVGYGVISGGVVSAQSTPNMTVQVTACTYKTSTGTRKTATANSNLAITTADATNPRIDIIYINSSGVTSYLQGTAAASPVAPTTPTGGFLLAQINVSANATSVTNSNIADMRKILISTDYLNAQLSEKANDDAYSTDTGTVNNIVVADVTPTAYKIGQRYRIKAKFANTGACTIKVGTLAITPIKKHVSLDLVTGDILLNQIITVIFDGTNFQIVPDFNVQLGNKINKTDKMSEIQFAVRDASVTGTQTITGLSGLPKRIEIRSSPNDALTLSNCIGSWESGSGQSCITTYKNQSGAIVSGVSSTKAIIYSVNEFNVTTGNIQNVLNGQFDIAWAVTGTVASKSLNLQIIAYYY